MNPLLVCITGSDGSGKSTLIKDLKEEIKIQFGLDAEEVTVWDTMNHLSEKISFSFSKRNTDDYVRNLSPEARLLFIFHWLLQSMEIAFQKKTHILLLNAYWYKYCSSELAYGVDRSLIQKITEIFPEPDLLYYLDISAEETAERKKKFTGYETGFQQNPNKESFIEFQTKASLELEMLLKNKKNVKLNARLNLDTLKKIILEGIKTTWTEKKSLRNISVDIGEVKHN